MHNERITENLVRETLRDLGYYSDDATQVEEQQSQIVEVKKLLRGASKTGKGGVGSPEFIISNPNHSDFIIVFECKANAKYHENKVKDDPVNYAVDGVLHYAKHLSNSFNVIAVAVSGQRPSSLKISNYIYPRNSLTYKHLRNRSGSIISSIVPFSDYIEHGTFDPDVARMRHENLMEFSRELHNFMRDNAKLTESEKPLLVSGTLIALRNKAFAKSFDEYKPDELQKEWMRVIKEEFKNADIPHSKEYSMTQPYSSIAVHPNLGKADKKYPKGVLYELIHMLNEKVWPFISIYHDFDVVGQFYGEFLKYTGGDKKALGIVLTPRHVTELFSLLANVKKDSKVLDICAGTGGFLISAMHQMIKKSSTAMEVEHIKRSCLIGVENQPQMYALSASNMILRGDGKANLHQGNCFDEAITKELVNHECNVGFLNPPYSQSDEDLHELVFVKHMLDCLVRGGTGIAIVPMSCAISTHLRRADLLNSHTLEAVMTMPDEVFYPVGVITCVMIFTAHEPHSESDRSTWFGFWKNDGFIKTKHRGRIDEKEKWPAIRENWVSLFRDRSSVAGISVMRKVDHEDEWCAEAYMETDYSDLHENEFKKTVLDFLAFSVRQERLESVAVYITRKVDKSLKLSETEWQWFTISDIFELKKGKRLTKAAMSPGDTPFIGAIDSNNGLRENIAQPPIHSGGTISVNYNGNGVAEAFYQPVPYWCSDDVNVLEPKFELTQNGAMFIATIIRREKYRFSYGRKWHLERMKVSKIRLPASDDNSLNLKFMDNFVAGLQFASK